MLNVAELVGFITGVVYVVLAARKNKWCWLFGIVSSAVYIYLNFQWQLYYDSALQLIYVAMGFYGWWQWENYSPDNFPIKDLTGISSIKWISATLIFAIMLGALSYYYHPTDYSFADAALSCSSVTATYFTAKKYRQNWIWWICIDLFATMIYMSKGAFLTSLLFLIYAIAATYGLIAWRKQQV